MAEEKIYMTVKEIAQAVYKTERTVRNWVKKLTEIVSTEESSAGSGGIR